MNKRVLLTLFAFLISGGMYTIKTLSNDLKDDGLFGNVKTVLTTESSPYGKDLTTIRCFNKRGDITKEVLQTSDKNPLSISTFEPFENGKFIEYTNFNEQGVVTSKESLRLDLKGNVLSKQRFNGTDELISLISSHFDKQGNVTSTKEFDSSNKLIASRLFNYDDYGRLSYIENTPKLGESFYEFFDYTSQGDIREYKCVTASGDVLNQTISDFDTYGNKVKTTLYPSLRTSVEHQVNEYNEQGHLISSCFVTGDNIILHKEEYIYATNGLKLTSSVYDLIDDVLVKSYIINYDDKGNEVSRINYDDEGAPSSYVETRYEYDEQGNWLVKTERNNDEVLSVTKREIAYY